ncbi:Mariner Mos1 transposase [Cryptotermes secundus]|uniref:Mariner Mos1 transposase n=1 Tax=Cryptotermes secundus TaxID=105785 RepID=A0A2J7Q4H1_9NEOP|nr:Mariner Mos1 transposase [Cryptotermes secundus]
MADQKEQRVCVKFCFLLGKTAAETVGMLRQAFNDDALGKSQVYEWFSRFKSGNMSTEDMPRPGRPSTGRNDENIAKIKRAIDEDRRKTIDQLSEETNISWSTVQRILTEGLHMRRVSAKFVPRLLGDDQRENRVNVCRDFKSEVQNDPEFLKRIVTGDESWCYGYDPESKQSSSQWKTPTSPRPKKARQVRSNVKTMLICFFDVNGIVHKEFVPPGQTVNQHFYLDVLRRLRERVRRKRSEMWRNGNWLLHHDNAPAHTALMVRQFLTSNNMVIVPHPPYSPDLAPSDFFLFPRMKRSLKGKRFRDVDEVKENTLKALNSIQPQEFQHCFEQWQKHWDKCINAHGQYFEGD